VWAIVGSIDGASTHLAETVVAKARVSLVSPGSTDTTVNQANVAWAFSCLPSDDALARRLARHVADRGLAPALISATDHDSHVAVRALLDALRSLRLAPSSHVEVGAGEADTAELVQRTVAATPGAIVVVAAPRTSARLVGALRAGGYGGQIFGWASMGRRAFLSTAGPAAEGVVFPLPCDPGFAAGEFSRAFAQEYGRAPDCTAVQTYDATRLVIESIERVGLNRARIRDALAAVSSRPGAAGSIAWGPLGRNLREPVLATVREGRVVPLERPPEVERLVSVSRRAPRHTP